MYETVSPTVNPSDTLPGLPPQQAAKQHPEQPTTWTFTERGTGQPMTVTCMPGCILDHTNDIATPSYPGDIWCQAPRQDVTLPINSNGSPEEYRVLSSTLNVRPFDEMVSARLPFVSLEIIDDHWIEDLDPDGLETVIRTLAERLDDLREAHAELVRTRTEYAARRQA
ncbi:DUF6907 domain-containing protein [Streptomyces sp. NPDC020681]|uniref:DUF6907 domain-containing protein n=1 Tax=Streptomyces sp. NPDC020681 TaxID=3365083 RepID=UPI0037BC3FCD